MTHIKTTKQTPQVTALLQGKTFIDLFAGCGGMSLGLMQSGWHGLFAVEKDKFAFTSLNHNLIEGEQGIGFDWPSWLPKSPIRIGVFTKKYRKQLSLLRGKVALIVGGPPCQGFSFAGKRDKNDKRNRLFHQYVEVVELIRPPLLLLENVKGIDVEFGKETREHRPRHRKGRPLKAFSNRIREALEALGYQVYPDLVLASDFGVAQRRPRYIMFGIHKSVLHDKSLVDPFSLLHKMRNGFLKSKGLRTSRPINAGEAISDLETKKKKLIDCVDSVGFKQINYEGPVTRYQKILHGSKNGQPPNSMRLANHRDETKSRFKEILKTCRRGIHLSDNDRKRFKLKKHVVVPLDAEKPSSTLTTLPDDFLHYSEPRILTVREYARLQSFPDWFEFHGNYTTGGSRRVNESPRYSQVGNAVPPLLAEMLGEVLIDLRKKIMSHIR